MKAISLLQPYASLIMLTEKQWETRSWNTSYRGEILIHSSKKFDNQTSNLCEHEPFWTPMQQYWPADKPYAGFTDLPLGSILGYVTIAGTGRTQDVRNELSEKEIAFGDYSDNRWAWKLKDPVVFAEPIPWKGSLSIWEFPNEELKKRGIPVPGKLWNLS